MQPAEWRGCPEPPAQQLAEHRRSTQRWPSLQPQRPGVVDAYVVVVRARRRSGVQPRGAEAGRVLASRFDAAGRTIVLANDEGSGQGRRAGLAATAWRSRSRASPSSMNRNEDVLVLYTTSHGIARRRARFTAIPAAAPRIISPLAARGDARPARIQEPADHPPGLLFRAVRPRARGRRARSSSPPRREDRSSFGCPAGNDWTFFGDALINHAMRQPLPFDVQFRRASAMIAAAEDRDRLGRRRTRRSASASDTRRLAQPRSTRASPKTASRRSASRSRTWQSAARCARSSARPPSSIRRSATTARSRGSPAG